MIMILLAADTSTVKGSIALKGPEGEPVARSLPEGRPHSETLLTTVAGLLGDSGIQREDVNALAVGTGPGAFTGLRVGLATFKGWAFTSGLSLAAVPSLDAVAWPYLVEGRDVLVASDARKGEIYTCLYAGIDDDGLPVMARETALIKPVGLQGWLGGTQRPNTVAVGTGLELVRDILEDVGGIEPLGDKDGYPDALNILAIGERLYDLGRTVSPSQLKPFYVRRPDAVPAKG